MKQTTANSLKPPHELRFAVLAADTVVFTVSNDQLWVRLIPVHLPPHFLHLAGLPGGLLAPTETAEQAALRHVVKKGGLVSSRMYLEQLYTFSEVERDPRGRVVAVAFLGLTSPVALLEQHKEKSLAWWAPVAKLPKLAYDHRQIIATGLDRLRSRVTYTTLISKLMPREFTLTELEKMYEVILDRAIDKRNFRKKLHNLRVLEQLSRERRGEKHRPAKLYRFCSLEVQPLTIV